MPKAVKSNNARVTTRIVVVLVLTFVAVLALMMTYKLMGRPGTAFQTIDALRLTGIISGAAALCAAAAAIVLTARSHPKARLMWTAAFLIALLSAVSMSLHIFYVDAVQVLYIALPALAVLYLVYLLYQREFFTLAAALSVFAAGLWVVRQILERERVAVAWLCLGIMAVAAVIFCFLITPFLEKRKGKVRLFGREFLFARPKADYSVFRLSAGVIAACLLTVAVCMFFGAYAAGYSCFYVMLAVFGYLFVLAVYYTAKMIGE